MTGVQLRACGVTDRGRVRPTNQDCFAIREALGLLVVADGMGGHNGGEIAARLAVDAVVDSVAAAAACADPMPVPVPGTCLAGVRVGAGTCLDGVRMGSGTEEDLESWPFGFDSSLSVDGNLLRTAVYLADVRIREAAISSCDCAGMGTTIVAACISRGRLSIAHVGDSRLYLLSARTLRQITQDDSWLASTLAHDPGADRFVLEHHPMRHALTNVVGALARTEVHVTEQPLADGDLLLLTTDGVHATLDDRRLERLALDEHEPQGIAHAIVHSALTRGSRDNCTAVVARYEAVS
jgi:serine/threonine protein phosphatase PrpC